MKRLIHRLDKFGAMEAVTSTASGIEIDCLELLNHCSSVLERMVFPGADLDLQRKLAEINSTAFSSGKFGTGFDEKFVRNRALLEACPTAFHLLTGAFGFSGAVSVLPLNKRGYDDYTSGLIGDNQVHPAMLARKDEDVAAFLMFFISTVKRDRGLLTEVVWSSICNLVLAAIIGDVSKASVLAANSDRTLALLFRDCGMEKDESVEIFDAEDFYAVPVHFLKRSEAAAWLQLLPLDRVF